MPVLSSVAFFRAITIYHADDSAPICERRPLIPQTTNRAGNIFSALPSLEAMSANFPTPPSSSPPPPYGTVSVPPPPYSQTTYGAFVASANTNSRGREGRFGGERVEDDDEEEADGEGEELEGCCFRDDAFWAKAGGMVFVHMVIALGILLVVVGVFL